MSTAESSFENLQRNPHAQTEPPFSTFVSHATQSAIVPIWLRIEAEIPFLRRAVRRWHRERAEADDLVQDTLLRALASAHLWQPGSNLRAWLVTIMRNQFLTNMASRRRTELVSDLVELPDSHASADAEHRLTLRDVERAVRRLPAKQRSAMVMAGIQGKSYSEVASAMGVSVDAVRCHLTRARQGLRKAVYRSHEPTWIA